MKQSGRAAGLVGLGLILIAVILLAQALVAKAQPSASAGLVPLVQIDAQHDTSRPLRELAQSVSAQPDRPGSPVRVDQVNRMLPARSLDPKLIAELIALSKDPLTYFQQIDPAIQAVQYPAVLPAPIDNFAGLSYSIAFPPDTVGDIGYDAATGKRYYVQWVNLSYAIWDVTGAPEMKYSAAGNTLWSDFGGPCQTTNDGDPIVLFDQLAGRWLVSQFALPNYPAGPYYQCIAISKTADPTGAYYRYAFQASATKLNDYPHLGVWPDGYYMTTNQFRYTDGGHVWGGAGATVFERDKMLQGQTARMVYFDLMSANSNFGGMLPTDLEGLTLPPSAAPNLFAEVDDNSITELGGLDALRLWKFHADWSNPISSTFGVNGQPDQVLPVAPFNWLPCVLLGSRSCIPQPGAPAVDAVGDRLMHRLTYRNFGDHAALLLDHTVDVGSGRAGIRWYEVRDPLGAPTIYQQGTYAPNDSASRWMGSLAMDHTGNMALGYSVSSATIYPSIRYAGRLVNDPLGELAQGENSIVTGAGSQTDVLARWGDYSSMNLDPVDDCTFWYTQEYYPATAPRNWHTRIASFRFPNCSTAASGVLRGTVRESVSNSLISNSQIMISSNGGPVIPVNAPFGVYTLTLPAKTYTLTASAYGYAPGVVDGVSVTENLTKTQDVLLDLSATYIVSGYVTGYLNTPLYATLTIVGLPFDPPLTTISTDPVTGFYSVTLASDQSYTLSVSSPLHVPQIRGLGALNADRTEDFSLTPTTEVYGGVIGWVRNLTTQQPVISATIAITPGLEVTTDRDGYYEALSLLPGVYTITATAPLYEPLTAANVSVPAGRVAIRAFDLAASHLSYSPPTLERTLIFGTAVADAAGIVLSNTGQLPLSFALTEAPAAIWFDSQPLTGTVPVSNAQDMQLDWRGDLLDQPGVVTTTLHLQSDDPLATNVRIPVTLTLQPTVTQGLLTGVVSTTGVCDVHLAPIAGAQLHVQGFDEYSRTIATDEAGLYRYWLDQTHSPYTITLTARDHLTTTTSAAITGGLTTTQNTTLRMQQPCLTVTPLVLSANLNAGQSTTQQFVITNTGAAPLNATIYEVFANSIGGPDAAGYTWRRAAYEWIDATDEAALNLTEDGAANIVLPFDFPYYDTASHLLRVSNNGALLLATFNGDISYLNQPLINAPANLIAPFWDDLDNTQGGVYWKTIGSAPNRRAVFEWHARPHIGYTPGAATFEVILSENGNVAFQYQTLDFGEPAYDNGASATVGVRGVGPNDLLQISHDTPILAPQQAYCFTRPGNPPCDVVDNDWLSVAPMTITNLAGSPPMTQPITVTLLAAPHLGSGVTGTLRVVTGDPFQPETNLSVALRVAYPFFLPLIRR